MPAHFILDVRDQPSTARFWSAALDRALAAGAAPLSPPTLRDWGDIAAYCRCPDGHILAFADPSE